MMLLDRTLATPEENLALDEVLLEMCDRGQLADGVLRLWEADSPFVVVGRGSRIAEEVDQAECRQRELPILRRVSGGLTIITGPGCLMYAVVEPTTSNKIDIEQVHRRVLCRLAEALQGIGLRVSRAGTSDLAIQIEQQPPSKVSGNSLRMGRRSFLYHGTLLYDFDLSLIARCLLSPPRTPDYRAGRDHRQFVANLPADGHAIRPSSCRRMAGE